MYSLLLETITLVFVYFLIFFIVGTLIKNNSIVDMGWGIGFVIVAWFTLFRGGNFNNPNLLVTLLVTIWGTRLFYHIVKRNWKKPEDFRYATWRKEWGKWLIPRAFLQVYMLQGVFMLLVSSSVIFLNGGAGFVTVYSVIGAVIWVIGFYFEAVGDYQLEQFKKNKSNKGKILDTGLWKYTRHPNYFGEATMWWGIGILAWGSGATAFSFISPIVITFLLLFVSGVPMLEKAFANRPGYEEYKAKTSIFIPLPPKKIK